MLGTRSEDDFEKVSTTNTNTVLDYLLIFYGSQTQIEDPPPLNVLLEGFEN